MKKTNMMILCMMIVSLFSIGLASATTTVNTAVMYPSPLYSTNPATLYLDVTDAANNTLTVYTQFDIDSVDTGTVRTQIINQNRYDMTIRVASLGAGPYAPADVVGATYWVNNGTANTSAVRTTKTVQTANNKILTIALCDWEDDTGICRPDSPYFNLFGYSSEARGEFMCAYAEAVTDAIQNSEEAFPSCNANGKYALVTQNITLSEEDCFDLAMASMGCDNLVGKIRAHNNETHLIVDSITNEDYGRGITYATEQPIAYAELDFATQTFADENGTLSNASFALDFFAFGDNMISVDSDNVPTAEAEATLMWEDVGREPSTIYKDGAECSEADCSDRTYNSATGDYSFVTTEFSSFSLGYDGEEATSMLISLFAMLMLVGLVITVVPLKTLSDNMRKLVYGVIGIIAIIIILGLIF